MKSWAESLHRMNGAGESADEPWRHYGETRIDTTRLSGSDFPSGCGAVETTRTFTEAGSAPSPFSNVTTLSARLLATACPSTRTLPLESSVAPRLATTSMCFALDATAYSAA